MENKHFETLSFAQTQDINGGFSITVPMPWSPLAREVFTALGLDFRMAPLTTTFYF